MGQFGSGGGDTGERHPGVPQLCPEKDSGEAQIVPGAVVTLHTHPPFPDKAVGPSFSGHLLADPHR